MNVNVVAKNYNHLTPEERFRLILAASGRGDEAEKGRLANAGRRITVSMPDHSPYAHAFNELAHLTFIELLNDAHCYTTAMTARDDEAEGSEAEGSADKKRGRATTAKQADLAWASSLGLALACGFVLRTKADGWRLFCDRLNVPVFLLWEGLPGSDWLESALTLAAKAAFAPGGFLRWLIRSRPEGEPEITAIPLLLTAEGIADENAKAYRTRAEWWAGRS